MPLSPSTLALSPIELAQALIQCPSVTPSLEQPEDTSVIDVLEQVLQPLGFECTRLSFEQKGYANVTNLYARLGQGSPHICFAGHYDVVPVGDAAAWTHPPFGAEIDGEYMIGRGTEDMKGAIAAFIAAVSTFLANKESLPPGGGAGETAGRVVGGQASGEGSISLLLSGDEEGPAVNGTPKMLEWLKARGELPDMCLVGEPTNVEEIGDMAKIGRRGSIGFHLTVEGVQGHVAYPERAANPTAPLVHILSALKQKKLDEGTEFFPPSNLEISSIDVGNPAVNVIPARAEARFNIRFNTEQSGDKLEAWVRELCDQHTQQHGCTYTLNARASAQPFITQPGALSNALVAAVKEVTGRTPALTTTGGTSDARFIQAYCPVIEFGTTGKTAHQVDERVRVRDLEVLAEIYGILLKKLLA